MPYRRLPNTDKARIRSLATAVDKMKNSYYYAPVLSPELFNRAEKKLQQFREVVDRYLAAQKRQVSNSKSDIYQTRLKNARMYVSHFLTVFNLCVKRGEMKASDRLFYSLDENNGELPDLSSDISELRRLTEESLAAVALMRPEIDEVIVEVWNSVENYFKDLEGEKKLKSCRDYGLIYYYRKGEKTD